MEASEFEVRKAAVLSECEVSPAIFEQVIPRLERFMEPFVASLGRREQGEHAVTFVQGLLSDLSHKNAESIAYRFGQERMPLQNFLGASEWDDGPLRDELARQIGRELGEPDGVFVIDPSAFPKSGRESVGVARQWCGRLGKTDNCQVAVFLGYVSRHEHALVDMRLYLPEEWTQDAARMKKAGVPKGTKFRTRHELTLELLAQHAVGSTPCDAAASVDHRRRRDGPSELVSPGFARVARAVPAGRAKQHVDPRSRGGTAGGDRSRSSAEASVAECLDVGSRAARHRVDRDRCARRLEGTAHRRAAEAARPDSQREAAGVFRRRDARRDPLPRPR